MLTESKLHDCCKVIVMSTHEAFASRNQDWDGQQLGTWELFFFLTQLFGTEPVQRDDC